MGLTKHLHDTNATRRTFLKGMAALGAAGVITGCGGNSDNDGPVYEGGSLPGSVEPEDLTDLSSFDKFSVTCPHNCGPTTRCVSTIWVKNGRIKRVTSEDSEVDGNGVAYNKDINDARKLNCAKGRAYKGRVHHNGRLKYPMKQTKQRGDLTGFVRISWEEAYDEVLRKYWAILAKYGPRAIRAHSNINSGSAGNGDSASAMSVITQNGGSISTYSDHSFHQYNYCYNIVGVPGSNSYGSLSLGSQIWGVYNGKIKNWVSFGTNSMTTNNTLSHVYLKGNQKAVELAKQDGKPFKHYVISPELTDTGVLCATDWVQIRNQTDPALIAAMIYEMIVNTFNTDGTIKDNPWLDVDYIDTILYGFFDSPEYWVSTSGSNRGAISLTEVAGYRKISAVPAGQSYAAWIMGSDDRLTKAMYDDSRNTKGHNYTAKQYVSDSTPKVRAAKCSLPVKGAAAHSVDMNSTSYYTKKDYMTPKTPEWAEKICGTPASMIRELAALYAKEENKPILTEWTGGLQKSENGVITLMAIQTLFAVTKNWGWNIGSTGGMYQTWATGLPGNMGDNPSVPTELSTLIGSVPGVDNAGAGRTGSSNPATSPAISIAEHNQGLLFAFKDQLNQNPKWTGYANPYWDGETRYLHDGAGAKTLVLYKREEDGTTLKTKDVSAGGTTRKYYDWVTDDSGAPVFSGIRMHIGGAGVIMNGTQNPNWVAEILQCLPLATVNPDDPDTFCMAAFDFHLHAHVRFADYVFPVANTLEGPSAGSPGGRSFVRPGIVTPPGEALVGWDAAYLGWRQRYNTFGASKTFTRIDGGAPFNLTTPEDAHFRVIGETTSKSYISQNDKYYKEAKARINALTPNSPYYGKPLNKLLEMQIRPINQQDLPTAPADPAITNTTRLNLDSYLAGTLAGAPLETAPFVTFATNRQCEPSTGNTTMGFTTEAQAEIPATGTTGASSGTIKSIVGRMSCYAEFAVKAWERSYDMYHGWLPEDKRGNRKVDYENDPFILPIPLYYDFRDAFNEMYGVYNPNPARRNLQAGWKLIGPKPATNDISLIKDRLTVTFGNSHDRYRSHSSTAENPYTRELNCRVKGGGWASGNDWKEYGVIPDVDENNVGGNAGIPAMRSAAIANRNMKTASWHEFWLNDEDAAQYNIKDGDLIRVSNPVGAVRCTARVTARIVRGHGQLHHGAWYDPNPVDGVDDGGCPSTLTSSRSSKLDNGNALHCAYCVIEKETSF